MMSENNVAFRLECYDEVSAIAFNRYSSPSSISKRFANFVGDHRHHAPLAADRLRVAPPRNNAAVRGPRQRRVELSTNRTMVSKAEKLRQPIATTPADVDVELSIHDKGEYHALVVPCEFDGSG
jgi:hypothetical protein